jgi:hypothetical protein
VSLEELLGYNAARLDEHRRLRVYRFATDGTLEDRGRRDVFLACAQRFSRHFQMMLHARQAHCADERFCELFAQHLRDEVGHDELLRMDFGRRDELWDPVAEACAAWFVVQMSSLDNIEKLAVMHLVVEATGAYMGGTFGPAMLRFGASAYYKLHDEVDQSHVTLAIEPLRRQPPETLARVRTVVGQAWRVLAVWLERVAALVLGD